ncbi:MAG TPA: DUF4157 domain-containing protein [Candidatus Evtepia faecigallinarum]|nr:DUF4157 domain-containing protein [Candidatus Evtepia faecigallinarum]
MQLYESKRKAPASKAPAQEPKAVSRSQMLRLSGAGEPQPMSPALRERFEPGFAADFSNIRISRGRIPEEMGVQAVAQGTDILLDSRAGMDVLGHELAHVVQQAQGRVAGGYPVVENAALEHEADVMGQRAAAGLEAQVGGFGGETLSIAPMSGASAPAQCKRSGRKKKDEEDPSPREENIDLAPMDLRADMTIDELENRPQPAFESDVGRMAEMRRQRSGTIFSNPAEVLEDDPDLGLPLAPDQYRRRR